MNPIVVPVVLIFLAMPMVLGKVPRNGIYGFRTAYTMSSDRVWRHANRIGGVAVMIAGLFWLALVVVLPLTIESQPEALATARSLGRLALVAALVISLVLVYRDRRNT